MVQHTGFAWRRTQQQLTKVPESSRVLGSAQTTQGFMHIRQLCSHDMLVLSWLVQQVILNATLQACNTTGWQYTKTSMTNSGLQIQLYSTHWSEQHDILTKAAFVSGYSCDSRSSQGCCGRHRLQNCHGSYQVSIPFTMHVLPMCSDICD